MKFFQNETEALIVKEYLNMLLDPAGKLTVRNICQHCFISRRTFYNYFETIRQLEEKAIVSLFLTDSDALFDFEDFTSLLAHLDHRRPYVARLLQLSDLQPQMHRSFARALNTVFQDAYAAAVPPLLCSGLAYVVLEWLGSDSSYSIQEMARLCSAFLLVSASLDPPPPG